MGHYQFTFAGEKFVEILIDMEKRETTCPTSKLKNVQNHSFQKGKGKGKRKPRKSLLKKKRTNDAKRLHYAL